MSVELVLVAFTTRGHPSRPPSLPPPLHQKNFSPILGRIAVDGIDLGRGAVYKVSVDWFLAKERAPMTTASRPQRELAAYLETLAAEALKGNVIAVAARLADGTVVKLSAGPAPIAA